LSDGCIEGAWRLQEGECDDSHRNLSAYEV
jgi:hypothetical protein